jgi:hypothetical protein
LFAPKGEKQLYKAVKAQDTQAIKQVGAEHPISGCPRTASPA